TTFFRNRLRHELIPFLESYNPNIREILFRTADVMAGEYELLRGLIEEARDDTLARNVMLSSPDRGDEASLASPQVGPETPSASSGQALRRFAAQGDMIVFDLVRWRALPLALQRALLREAVHCLRPGLRNVDFTPVDNAVHWSQTAESGHTADLLGGLCVKVVGSEMCVCAWDQSPREASNRQSPISNLLIPGETPFLNHTFTVTLLASFSLADIESNPDPWTVYLDAGLAPFVLRTRRPGDRFEPLGMHGTTKVSDFMINRKMPVDAREGWPLLACGENGETVLWVCGYAVSERAKVTKNTGRVVKVRCLSLSSTRSVEPRAVESF
ncbi:MAG TPA: tRNA lysidine(34) synthetase TilS, partial [Anaerolineales bacterium]|nr:tRNA lysidine(34) synthetase TilS [Anaerolineales bacterium]